MHAGFAMHLLDLNQFYPVYQCHICTPILKVFVLTFLLSKQSILQKLFPCIVALDFNGDIYSNMYDFFIINARSIYYMY